MAELTGLEPLLRLLSDGAVHSGEALGEALGISRAAVWKQLQKLQAAGVEVNAVKGSGYQLATALDLLDGKTLAAELRRSLRLPFTLQVDTQVASTNREAMAWAATAAADSGIFIALAEQQSAGRGRRGRDWVSPLAANIYLSLVASFSAGAAALEGLSLADGVAVRRALQRFDCETQLKWPNDILCAEKKLGGILLEMTGDPVGDCRVVIGVGLNVAMPADAAGAIGQPWTDLRTELGVVPRRTELALALIEEVVEVTTHFQSRGFSYWRDEWLQASAWTAQAVQVEGPAGVLSGVMIGVDDSGALLLQDHTGSVQRIVGGELSLRREGGER